MNNDSPKVYISYSDDSKEHIISVSELATQLRLDGVDIILDMWDLRPGDDIKTMREKWMTESDSIILIVTETYLKNVRDATSTSAGLEFRLLEKHLASNQTKPRVIPLIWGLQDRPPLPFIIEGRHALEFRSGMIEEVPGDLICH